MNHRHTRGEFFLWLSGGVLVSRLNQLLTGQRRVIQMVVSVGDLSTVRRALAQSHWDIAKVRPLRDGQPGLVVQAAPHKEGLQCA